MDNKDVLWKQFYSSGKVCDYLEYCAVKEGTNFGNEKGTSEIGRVSGSRNECRGE